MRPNSNPRRLPIRNIRRGVKFQNKNQSYAPIVRTSLNGASLQRLCCFDLESHQAPSHCILSARESLELVVVLAKENSLLNFEAEQF